jgi:hypothetical protein
LVDARLTQPNGHGERVTALHLEPHADHPQASTPPASRISLRSMKARPRVHRTQTTARWRSTDAPREPPDALGQRTPRTDRGAFGWMKTIGGQEKTKSLATSQPSLLEGCIAIEFAYHNGNESRPQSQTRDSFNSLLGSPHLLKCLSVLFARLVYTRIAQDLLDQPCNST